MPSVHPDAVPVSQPPGRGNERMVRGKVGLTVTRRSMIRVDSVGRAHFGHDEGAEALG